MWMNLLSIHEIRIANHASVQFERQGCFKYVCVVFKDLH